MYSKNELLNEFIQESQAHITEMETGLLRMEAGDYDIDMINGVFRAVHSIKGTAGFFELNKVVELSHAIENLLGALRDQKIRVTPDMVDALLFATDALKGLVSQPAESESRDIAALVADVKSFLPDIQEQEGTDNSRFQSVLDKWNQLTASENQEEPDGATPQSRQALIPVIDSPETSFSATDLAAPNPQPAKNGNCGATVAGDSVRVGVELLDDLLNMVGEMVLRRNQLLRIAQNAGKDVPYLDIVSQGINNLTTSLQEKVMKTRMQPVANIFNKFPRIVRELSRKLDKEVELVMQGMNVELDRSIIEALIDPITHLVRNALGHGIELPEIRVANNKPPTGIISLHAYHESGRVIIDIHDDGAGVDLEKIKAKALQKGWISEREAVTVRETEILNFIMRPGFSTADCVTDISGRGVGMDVVKTNIEKLGGKVEILTELGLGVTVRLILPLTLAIISSLIVEAAGDAFAVPQANIKELVLIQPWERHKKRVEFIQSSPVLRLRNQLLPLVRLADVLRISPEHSAEYRDNYAYFADEKRTFRILVIKSGNFHFGLVVDAVYDTEEILVKPVPAALSTCGCYSGVTVLGDGRIAMIIDLETLRADVSLCPVEDTARQVDAKPVMKAESLEEQYLLLFKCSGAEMLGLDLAMVSRIEEVPLSHIQKIGAKHYFSYQGQTIRVIRPEHYLPISRSKNNISKVYIILPKLVKHPIGIIAEKIHDAILTTVRLDANGVCGQGIVGSTMVDDTIVTFFNIHDLFQRAAPEYFGRKSAAMGKTAIKYSGESLELKKAIILLVEDMAFFMRTTKSYLESDGYEVIAAENGREALEILAERKVDVVISDIEMPIMNGIELVRAIRSSEKLKHLPVIALTSLTGEGYKEKGLRAGFDLYEFKLNRMRLLESVNEILQKNNRHKG